MGTRIVVETPARTSSPIRLWIVALVALTVGVYISAYWGDFFLDDNDNIAKNQTLRDPLNLSKFMTYENNTTRPVVQMTFALDYALFGKNSKPFHILNVLIHAGAAVLLFSIVRRSLLSPRLAGHYASAASPLAYAVALLWAVHPLQTESVTYIVQRHESLMGLFFLLGLYAMIRGAESPRRLAWHACAIAAAVLGAGCKQVIVALPVVALLYDRCFISGSLGAALKRAPFLYAGLLVLPSVLIVALIAQSKPIDSAGISILKITPWEYARSQFVVVTHYLRLVVYPVNLCVYYAWKIETDPLRIVPAAAFILLLLGLGAQQLWKNTVAGFWAGWFFVILAPTSTIFPIRDLAFEHRMYLSLAGIMVLLVLGLYALRPYLSAGRNPMQWGAGVLGLLAVTWSALTVQRNIQYHDSAGLILDTLINTPHDAATQSRLAQGLLKSGAYRYARDLSENALKSDPNDSAAHANLGELALLTEEFVHAEDEFRKALQSKVPDPRAQKGLVNSLMEQGKDSDVDALLANEPDAVRAKAQMMLGNRAFNRNRFDDAARCFKRASERSPEDAEIATHLGIALAADGKDDEALVAFSAALRQQPRNGTALYNRGMVLERKGGARAAIADYREAVAINPENPKMLNSLAWLLATAQDGALRNGKDALAAAEKACELTHRMQPTTLDVLAAALAENGRFDDAVKAGQDALKLVPPEAPLAKEINAHIALFQAKNTLHQH